MASPAVANLDILTDLAVIMGVAAVTTVLFQKIKQPVVLGYLLAGLIIGHHLPIPLFANEEITHELSEIGVILLMFTLGLEFSLRKLVEVAPTAGVVAAIQCGLMITAGYATGRLFGWTGLESFFTGALIAISSTTIIVKAFAENGIKGRLADFVFGILIVEDLIAILLLAVLTPIASGAQLSPGELVWTVARLGAFLAGMLVIGLLLVPRLMRFVLRIGRAETTLVVAVGICFACALLARRFGYSVALGAFLGGALVAESGHGKTVEHALESVRDLFAAVFFVSVGMLIDPVLVARNWAAVLVLTVVVVVGKVFGVTLGSFLAGRSIRTSVQAGMSLAQIGEFSFIIAGVGLSLNAVGSFLYPVAVAVSAVTTLVTPFLIRASGRAASFVDARLPPPLQTFASLYGSWVAALRATPTHATAWSAIRRYIRLLLIDMGGIIAVVILASVNLDRLVELGRRFLPLPPELVRWAVIAGAAALAAPFILGAIRVARTLARMLVAEALPDARTGDLDLAAASRRILLVTAELVILLIAGIPVAALTQPFVRSFPVIVVLLVGLLLLIWPFWKSATNLHGHVRAGAEVILEALANQAHAAHVPASGSSRDDMRRLVPGLGETATVTLAPGGRSTGKTLKQLDLRGLTGATVIAIDRPTQDVVYPKADEVLQAGDVLVLAGTDEAITLARDVLARDANAGESSTSDAQPESPG